MEASAGFGTSRLFFADSRLVLGLLNNMRHQALNRAFGTSREEANVLTVVLLLGAAEGVYEAGRRIGATRVHVSATDGALGAIALRGAALGVAGPTAGAVPGFGALAGLAILGGVAVPGLRRMAHRMRTAEQRLRAAEARVRRERISRYAAARAGARAT